MEVKVLEVRDAGTFLPVICVRPVAENEGQRYLLRRDGYRATGGEECIIMVDAQCRRGAQYDPYNWKDRTHQVAHDFIQKNWARLHDGDVIDVEYILGESEGPKRSERHG